MITLTACGSQAEITAVSVRTEAKAPTITYSPSPKESLTLASTKTITLTATLTEMPTATLLYLSPPPTNVPTKDITEWAYFGWTSTSPDGQWVADYFLSPFNIYNHTGWMLWELPYDQSQLHVSYYGGFMSVYGWSPDSRYVYFGSTHSNNGGYLRSLGSAFGLWRLDITSGEVKEILSISDTDNSRSISILPDKDLFAYTRGWSESMPVDLIIKNLDTGEEIVRYSVGENAFYLGSLRWSADGKKIFYIELAVDEYNVREMPEVYRYLLMMIDFDTGEKTLLLDMGDPGYDVYQSDEYNIVKLQNVGYRNDCEIYDFNFYKKEFVGLVTATPDPKFAEVGMENCDPTPTPTPTP
jgi:dipeptidyl aminopeptidase/acylaminoacyl peptidase